MKLAAGNFVDYRLKQYQTQSGDDKTDFLTNYVERQDKIDQWIQKTCETCELLINGELEWAKHIKTKKHLHN